MMLHRAASAGNMNNMYNPARRSSSPSVGPLNIASSGASLMPHRKPDFQEGSILEERDSRTQRTVTRYRVGPLLGQGGFAKCYDVKDLETGEHWALKVCERQKLIQTKTLGKLQTEIAVHRRMNHKNIVKFHRTFQDEWNIYIVLELCLGRTLMDLSKQRKRFTVPETQFVMIQTLMACDYMHTHNVIHRDLKLGNMMLDADMNLKLGDFGLAAELLYDGERKRTICGTPNYIAPEILQAGRDGHSFEVDIWSVGVIMYTLLVGEPPFQTSDVKATYNRIKQCRYNFPVGSDVPESAKQLVHKILQSNPNNRPTLMDIRNDPFFSNPKPPALAPLSMFPSHLRAEKERQRANMANNNNNNNNAAAPPTTSSGCGENGSSKAMQQQALSAREALRPVYNGVPASWPTNSARGGSDNKPITTTSNNQNDAPPVARTAAPPAPLVRDQVLAAAPSSSSNNNNNNKMDDEEREHMAAVRDELHRTIIDTAPSASATTTGNPQRIYPDCPPPQVWVTDYADFSSRYGLAYRLSSGHTGVHYNDNTKLVWEPVSSRAEYYTRVKENVNGQQVVSDQRSSFLMESAPETLNKKTTLIKYFRSYIKAGGRKDKSDSTEVVRCTPISQSAIPQKPLTDNNMTSEMIYVKRWMLTSQAMVFRLSNRVIQVCFFDKSEVILASESKIVTFTDPSGARRTMPLTAVNSEGGDVSQKLMFTKEILSRLIANRDI